MNKTQEIKLNPQTLTNWKNILESHFPSTEIMADFIKYPVITEKTYLGMFKHRQYTFDVDNRLTKPQIKSLFENLFNVNIIGINTHRPPRKKVRVGTVSGYRPAYKRVILTLKEGQTIQFDS